jgi:hypothetical protein
MKAYLIDTLLLFLGRRLAWRVGRALYQSARHEAATTNITAQEELVQQVVIGRVDEPVLVDVGANTGSWSCRALSLLKERHCLLLAFEPDKDAMIELKLRLGVDPLSWTLFNVGGKEGPRCPAVALHIRRNFGRS